MRSYTESIEAIEGMRKYFGSIGKPWAQVISREISLTLDAVRNLPASTDSSGEFTYRSKTADRLADAAKRQDIDDMRETRKEVAEYIKVFREAKGISPDVETDQIHAAF